MRVLDSMHIYKEGRIYVKWAFCPECKYERVIAVMDNPPKCIYCKERMNWRYKDVGNLNYEDYFTNRTAKRMKRGKND